VPLLEQGRVVVGRRAVEDGDRGVGDALLLDALDQRLALQAADRHVVEAHVVVGVAVEGEAVVVDHRHALRLGVVDDRRAAARVEVDQQQDGGAVGDRLLGLGLLGRGVALGVQDLVVVGRQAGGLERLLEEAPVVALPPRGAGAVGEQHRDDALALGPAAVVGGGVVLGGLGVRRLLLVGGGLLGLVLGGGLLLRLGGVGTVVGGVSGSPV